MPPSFARQALANVGAKDVPEEIPACHSHISASLLPYLSSFHRRNCGRLARTPSVFVGGTPHVCTPRHRHGSHIITSHNSHRFNLLPTTRPQLEGYHVTFISLSSLSLSLSFAIYGLHVRRNQRTHETRKNCRWHLSTLLFS